MTTFNTYQEAKIANPECAIFEYLDKFGTDKDILDTFDIHSVAMRECYPADYCMTIEKFLADGHKFVDGDVFLNQDGELVEVGKWYQSIRIEPEEANTTVNGDENSFILRAAALEEKPFLQTGEDFEHSKTLNFIRDRLVEVHGEPKNLDYMHKLNNAIAFVERMEDVKKNCGGIEPKVLHGAVEVEQEKPKRTREEYVKVDISDVGFCDIAELFFMESDGKFVQIGDIDAAKLIADKWKLHRRTEVEVSERDEFIEVISEMLPQFDRRAMPLWAGKVYDSGKFKLIN